MKNKAKIWEPGTIAYQRFQFTGPSTEMGHEQTTDSSYESMQEEGVEEEVVHVDSLVSTVQLSETEEQQETRFSVEDHLAKISQESYHKGYEEGRRLGFEEAIQQALKQTHQLADYQQKIAASLSVQMKQLQERSVHDKEKMVAWLGKLVEEVSRQVIRREIQTHPEHIIRVIRDTLALIPNESEYVIHVNEKDSEMLARMVPDLGVTWHMLVSEEVERGNCLIVGRESEAQASMDVRLEECLSIIKESLPEMVTSEP